MGLLLGKPWGVAQLKEYSGGVGVLDAEFGYTPGHGILLLCLTLLFPARYHSLASVASVLTVAKWSLALLSLLLTVTGLTGMIIRYRANTIRAHAPVSGKKQSN